MKEYVIVDNSFYDTFKIIDIYGDECTYWEEYGELIQCYETYEDAWINSIGNIVFETRDLDEAVSKLKELNGD